MNALEFVKNNGWHIAESQFRQRKYDNKFFFFENHSINFDELETLLNARALVKKFGGLKKCESLIEGNILDASYVSYYGDYYRYGAYNVSTVRDGKWVVVYGGIDSDELCHITTLIEAIKIMKQLE